jgi:eukaryotic-like serine/threonine-protein kinase
VTVLAGRYELGDVLGEGGMGRVVVAHDLVLQREVAVKLLTGTADVASRARFLREAQGTARLRHPNAVTVFDTGEHEGQPFIVMELVRGITLAELLERDGPLDIEVAVGITAGVLEALAAAHDAGLVHRDVKPANVILPDDGGVKLTDFGIAKARDEASAGLTVAGTVLGTPTYLAPELVDGGTASPASDLYAVGCMLYVLLAGRPPFTAETPLAVAYAHLNQAVPPIEQVRPEVPGDLRLILAVVLAKDPADRYSDAMAMRDALFGGPSPEAPTDATLPLTTALAAGAAAPVGGSAPRARGPSDASAPDGAVAAGDAGDGTARHAASEPTVALQDGSDPPGAPRRSPWVAFAVVAVVLLAIVALAVGLPTGGGDPADDGADEEPVDEPEAPADETDGADGADGVEDEPDAEPDETDGAEDEPDAEPDAPAPEEPDAEPEAPEEPDAPDDGSAGDDADQDGPGGVGPDGEGPPGQNDPPGQAD